MVARPLESIPPLPVFFTPKKRCRKAAPLARGTRQGHAPGTHARSLGHAAFCPLASRVPTVSLRRHPLMMLMPGLMLTLLNETNPTETLYDYVSSFCGFVFKKLWEAIRYVCSLVYQAVYNILHGLLIVIRSLYQVRRTERSLPWPLCGSSSPPPRSRTRERRSNLALAFSDCDLGLTLNHWFH